MKFTAEQMALINNLPSFIRDMGGSDQLAGAVMVAAAAFANLAECWPEISRLLAISDIDAYRRAQAEPGAIPRGEAKGVLGL